VFLQVPRFVVPNCPGRPHTTRAALGTGVEVQTISRRKEKGHTHLDRMEKNVPGDDVQTGADGFRRSTPEDRAMR